MANKTLAPMIGRASHRFNLAVQALTREDDDILDKVHALMVKLNTIKNRHHLREADALMPVYRNTTRWSSTFPMIDRYFRIYSKLDRIDDQSAGSIPTPPSRKYRGCLLVVLVSVGMTPDEVFHQVRAPSPTNLLPTGEAGSTLMVLIAVGAKEGSRKGSRGD
ncbi:hypothetical protein L917_18251 [Phytophthora nicotianae]|uniref:Uncharacterized protein n=2 Tax=Phytophthora nicotianae TaxID=4792 RepID=V9EYX4_PHYNI|nr:hypothetical protein F443_10850 [Phytophthora nicotianae P1569]ETL81403.1 hypothetical protein L917_18251 [Phytophthora nicotianae]ETM34609.1 hypothetical protein L914_18335 [Phytophthora nicotianae]